MLGEFVPPRGCAESLNGVIAKKNAAQERQLTRELHKVRNRLANLIGPKMKVTSINKILELPRLRKTDDYRDPYFNCAEDIVHEAAASAPAESDLSFLMADARRHLKELGITKQMKQMTDEHIIAEYPRKLSFSEGVTRQVARRLAGLL